MRHHYDVSNEFFALFLDDSMTYSCALLSRGADDARGGPGAKLELVCAKLALEPGERMLDIGCGWGSFAIHAAAHARRARHGDHALREPGGARAPAAGRGAGLADRVEIRVLDYRDLADAPFDAVASIGMVEHVGNVPDRPLRAAVRALLRPGRNALNHGIARVRHGDAEAGAFSERYVFPDAAPLHVSRVHDGASSAPAS